MLGSVQERLTQALADLVAEAQAKGWYRADLDPRVVAVFIQSYTLGKVVDDITPNHMDQDQWNNLIDDLIEKVLLT